MKGNPEPTNMFCIAVIGLPGSGKSTLGWHIARQLDIPLLDKDDYLESLFRERGIGNAGWRHKLSRESDLQFQRDAEAHPQVVLVSHWRAAGDDGISGTPIDWLRVAFPLVIELYCQCPVSEAARRFSQRNRHPGHVDCARTGDEVAAWMQEYKRRLPLSLGILIETGTTHQTDPGSVCDQLRGIINQPPGKQANDS